MPELPEVETVRGGLLPVFEGATFARVTQRRADLRFPFPVDFAARLEGRRVNALRRRAKYLLAELDSGEVLAMHMGMSGRFIIEEPGAGQSARSSGASQPADKHDHVIFTMSNGAVIRYNDARRFGYMALIDAGKLAEHPLFRDLGVEPLGDDLTPAYLAARADGRSQSLKAFLLDQRVVAGLGNIYVCEALYRARLSPLRAASVLASVKGAPTAAARQLVKAIKSVLADAIAAGGSTLRDYRKADGTLGYFQHNFAVYGREGQVCQRQGCGGMVERTVQNGRSTAYCPCCQR
jgi:formamidopyrimidine-DNA glycosylase